MGLSNSCLSSRPLSRRKTHRFNGLSSLLCGASHASSSCSTREMDNHPDKILVNSAGYHDQELNHVENPTDESSPTAGIGIGSGNTNVNGELCGNSSTSCVRPSNSDLRDHGTIDCENWFCGSKEVGTPCQTGDDNCVTGSSVIRGGSNIEASISPEDCLSDSVDTIVTNSEMMQSNSSSNLSYSDSHIENQMAELQTELISDLDMVPHGSGISLTSHSQRIEPLQSFIPSGIGFLVSNREQGQDGGSVVRLDMVTISSNILSGADSETATHEVERNDRRLFWDALARRSSRSRLEASAIVFSMDNNDDSMAENRWLLGFSDETIYDTMSSDPRHLAGRIRRMAEPRRHSRFEIWERLRGVLDDDVRRSSLCPSGLHPDGSCSCESLPLTGGSSAHASISRIIMLAEALFEVLDEIHRHPASLSLSPVSLPAPESVVNSFPIKSHAKIDKLDGSDDVEQCYICLCEYEEGEKIRILPCRHEYHMYCVDKWLKEIHGVCPLCRGDVCEGVNESSASNSF